MSAPVLPAATVTLVEATSTQAADALAATTRAWSSRLRRVTVTVAGENGPPSGPSADRPSVGLTTTPEAQGARVSVVVAPVEPGSSHTSTRPLALLLASQAEYRRPYQSGSSLPQAA